MSRFLTLPKHIAQVAIRDIAGYLNVPTFETKLLMNPAVLEFVACPSCKGTLQLNDSGRLHCAHCSTNYEVREQIPILFSPQADSAVVESVAAKYERMHSEQADPWHYGSRAAEILKRQSIIESALLLQRAPVRMLDIGCGSGYLSSELGTIGTSVFSMDVAFSAVKKAKRTCEHANSLHHSGHSFYVGSATALPFQSDLFDVVVVSDGLYEWNLPPPLQVEVLEECSRVLTHQGIAVFTDYLRPERFDEWIAVLKSGPLNVVSVHYLHDRLWYQLESALHLIEGLAIVKLILRNLIIAKFLHYPARFFGRRGSKHILIVAQK